MKYRVLSVNDHLPIYQRLKFRIFKFANFEASNGETQDSGVKKYVVCSRTSWALWVMVFVSGAMNQLGAQSLGTFTDIRDDISILKWNDLDSAIQMLTTLWNRQSTMGSVQNQATMALEVSKLYNEKRDCDQIEHWILVAEPLLMQTSDKRGLAELSYQKGYAAFCRGMYEDAMEHIMEGLKIMEELDDAAGIALGHLRLSRIFHFTFKMAQSAEYGKRAGETFERLENYPNAWDAWSFAGHGYRMEGDSLQAQICFEKGLAMAENSGIRHIMGLAYNDLGAFYMEMSRYDSAEIYFEKALVNRDTANVRQEMVIKNGLGQVFLATDQYQKCIDLLSGALKTVYQTGDIFFLTEIPEYIARSYEGLGQYDSAYKYMEINWKYSDSLFTQNQDEALEEMRSKYESDKKDALITQQQHERIYIIALLALALLLALLFYRRYVAKKKMTELLNKKNEEKDFLLREIHHRVKNNLQILSSLLSIQSEYIQDENALNAIVEGRNRVQSMSFIHQQLYSDDNVTAVDMQVYVKELCEHLSETFSSPQKHISILYENQIDLVDVETAIPLGLIINELITNSIKYAFKDRDQGLIHVRLWMNQAGLLCLEVKDDGNGPVDSITETASFGTDLVTILSQKLKGKISIDTEDGYSTLITFHRFKMLSDASLNSVST